MELWSKEAPLACRNFIQLSLEGYYDNTIVHRVIKNFMVQMGDPTGSGTGGESIWGKPFKDEVHGRIKFNHRGQVAMANCGRPNSNQSQFFITLDACDGLHGKHTIFGKVTGNTFYNVIRMGEVETGEADRPVNEIRITSVEVLVNPFDDIVTRLVVRDVKNVPQEEKKGKEITAVAVKNNKLLSFGDDDEEEESSNLFKMKSALDSKKRKRSDHQPSFMDNNSSVTMKEPAVAAVDLSTSSNRHDTELAAKNSSIGEQPHQKRKVGTGDSDNEDEVLMDEQSIMLAMKRVKRGEGLRAHGSEFMQLRNELLQSRRAVNVLTGSEATAVGYFSYCVKVLLSEI
jgi:peptidyl-prolyl cis-trans isomerase SDCCAG10